jgi:hypothetical protein
MSATVRDTIHDVTKSLAAGTNGRFQASAEEVRELAERIVELARKLEQYEAKG